MKLDRLAGNAALKAQLSAQAAARGLSHAYLISGPDPADRDTLASLLSAAMVCTGAGEKPCGVCPGCKKAFGGIHPDVIHIHIPEGKREILVEQARQMRADAFIRPNEADRKVYVIHNAQSMRTEAQNAILKVLEEGPVYAAFLLLADNPGALLPTIRSRCEGLALTPAGSDAVQVDDAVQAAALELLALLARQDETALYAWSVPLEKWDREALASLLTQAVALLRQALSPSPDAPAAVRSCAALPKKTLLDAADLLEQLRADTHFNVGVPILCGALCAELSRRCFERR